MFKAYFKIIGPSGIIVDEDILDPKITGFPKSEVAGVSASIHFPGNPYLKPGVAWNTYHPIHGSGSFFIKKNDGTTRIIAPILFSDENPFADPRQFSGLEHWNTEFWYYNIGEKPKRVKRIPLVSGIHQMRKSDWLDFILSGSDFSLKHRIQWFKL